MQTNLFTRFLLPAAVLMLAVFGQAKAQALASVLPMETRQAPNPPAQVSLESALNTLGDRFQVNIVYQSKVIDHITVPAALINQPKKLEDLLKRMLQPNALYFTKQNNIYIVLPVNAKTSRSEVNGTQSTTPATANPQELLTFKGNFMADQAQKRTITGRVLDENQQPLIAAAVTVFDKTTKTAIAGGNTDETGAFSIQIPATGSFELHISYVGKTELVIPVTDQTDYPVNLSGEAKTDEVVVIGYGSQKKIDATGSSVNLTGETIERQPITTIDQALQGLVAGVTVVNSGTPGTPANIQIRGINSISGNIAPIYVVDGVVTNDISFLNPSDIESITVLKDASSVAIYGASAGNGAILVTTKQGKPGKAKVTYTGYVGAQTTNNLVKMANASEYAQLSNEAYFRQNPSNPLPFPNTNLGAGTNWFDQVLQTSLIHSHDINISGGSEHNTYNFGAGFIDQTGTVKETDYNKVTLRLNEVYTLSNHFKVGENLGLSRYEQKNPNLANNVIHEAFVYDPTVNPGSPGNFGHSALTNSGNPVADQYYNNQDKLTGFRLLGNVFAEVSFLKYFKFRSNFNIDYNNNSEKNYTPAYFVSSLQNNGTSTLQQTDGQVLSWFWNNIATYDQTIEDVHHITITAGTEARQTNVDQTTLTAKNVPNGGSSTQYFSLGNPNNYTISDAPVAYTIFSYIARASYSYRDRYLFNTSIRSDVTSQYYNQAGDKPTIVSPTVGVGWRLSEESFMQSLKPVLSNLKLRYSWGRLPNANLPNPSIGFSQYGVDPNNPTNAVFGSTLQQGITSLNLINPDLRWEYTEESDFGLEAGFLNNKLTFEADYYTRNTFNLVTAVPLPALTGPYNTQYQNAGTIQNKGFEFAANWTDNDHKLKYSIGANLATLDNKVLYLQNGAIEGGSLGNGQLATITQAGLPIATYWGYQVLGVNQSGSNKGEFIYSNDRMNLGSNIPKFTYGVNIHLGYENFDLQVDLQGVSGNKIFNANRTARLAGYNFDEDLYTNRWHGAGTSNTYPSATNGSDSYTFPSSFFVESGSYFRIRNLQLGYTIPQNLVSGIGLSKIRIFAGAQNLLTLFGYKGFNPEVTGVAYNNVANGNPYNYRSQALNSGVDGSIYPLHATYIFGLNVGF